MANVFGLRRCDVKYAGVAFNKGKALDMLGRPDEAAAAYLKAIKVRLAMCLIQCKLVSVESLHPAARVFLR